VTIPAEPLRESKTMSVPSDSIQTMLQGLRATVDPFGIQSSLWKVQQAWLRHPRELADQLSRLGSELWSLQLQAYQALLGMGSEDLVPARVRDERFQDESWVKNPYLNLLKEYYLLYTRWLEDSVFATPDVDEKSRRRAAYWVRQGLNALAPSNYFWTNPQAVERFLETGGDSLLSGFRHWLADRPKGDVSMVDEEVFEVGRNLATTPGKVVFRNRLVELIQYTSTTEQVSAVPIVIIAPWINKYYILDINEKKSLVRYLVERGYTVFITSWKNPTEEMRATTLDDYMLDGILRVTEVAREICGVSQVHAVGYCIGGTLLSALMAWLARSDGPSPIAHWTLLTTLVDFSNPGDIDVFIDEDSVRYIERTMERRGYLDGRELAVSFRMLRSNSLIWHYVVHNYLYGEDPPQFDVLYWNTDCTRLPEAMHSAYLRELYLENKLVKPDALSLGGRPLDLGRIRTPAYVVGTEQDHIAPWKETFKVCAQTGGAVRYVLATSGHIIGIVNPPVEPPKRRYWVGDAAGATDPEAWRNSMVKLPGSWWEDWHVWLTERCGPMVAPPPLGTDTYPALADAPGTYVLER
jgi:polyhydroxyalkanoate synthase